MVQKWFPCTWIFYCFIVFSGLCLPRNVVSKCLFTFDCYFGVLCLFAYFTFNWSKPYSKINKTFFSVCAQKVFFVCTCFFFFCLLPVFSCLLSFFCLLPFCAHVPFFCARAFFSCLLPFFCARAFFLLFPAFFFFSVWGVSDASATLRLVPDGIPGLVFKFIGCGHIYQKAPFPVRSTVVKLVRAWPSSKLSRRR